MLRSSGQPRKIYATKRRNHCNNQHAEKHLGWLAKLSSIDLFAFWALSLGRHYWVAIANLIIFRLLLGVVLYNIKNPCEVQRYCFSKCSCLLLCGCWNRSQENRKRSLLYKCWAVTITNQFWVPRTSGVRDFLYGSFPANSWQHQYHQIIFCPQRFFPSEFYYLNAGQHGNDSSYNYPYFWLIILIAIEQNSF